MTDAEIIGQVVDAHHLSNEELDRLEYLKFLIELRLEDENRGKK